MFLSFTHQPFMEPSGQLVASQGPVEHTHGLVTSRLSSKLRCSPDPTMLLKLDDSSLKRKGLKMVNGNKVRKQCQGKSAICFITEV